MNKLIKCTHDSYGGARKIIYLNPTGIEKIEQSDEGIVTVFYQQHCAFINGNVNDIAELFGYKVAK